MNIWASIKEWVVNFFKDWSSDLQHYPVTPLQLDKFLKGKFKKLDYYERLDNIYNTCELEKAQQLADLIPIKYEKFVAEFHDCNKFAYEFFALVKRIFPTLPVGVTHVIKSDGSKHALNFIVYLTANSNPSFMFIEPQTGKLTYFDYKPYFILI